jgi:hypothetical protein
MCAPRCSCLLNAPLRNVTLCFRAPHKCFGGTIRGAIVTIRTHRKTFLTRNFGKFYVTVCRRSLQTPVYVVNIYTSLFFLISK